MILLVDFSDFNSFDFMSLIGYICMLMTIRLLFLQRALDLISNMCGKQ